MRTSVFSEQASSANSFSLRLAVLVAMLALIWVGLATVVVPSLIEGAYRGENAPSRFSLEEQLAAWQQAWRTVLRLVVLLGFFTLILNRPEIQRLVTPRRLMLVWAGLLACSFVFGAWRIVQQWEKVSGDEYYWIADGLISGNGFSVKTDERWMYPEDYGRRPETYHPTAWEEPVYPVFLAVFLGVFGERGKLPLALLQYAALIGACAVLYPLGKRSVGAAAGMLGGALLALSPDARWQAENYLSPAPVGTLLVAVTVLAIYRCRERPGLRSGVGLGLLLGIGSLTLTPLLLFVPVSMLLLVASGRRDSRARKAAIATLVAAIAVIGPWTLRNYVVFEQWVPVRTGAGLNAHLGNPVLAATFTDGAHACSEELGPMWRAAGARDAVARSLSTKDLRQAMFDRSDACVRLGATGDYDELNEAERDREHLRAAVAFIAAKPFLFARLVSHRLIAFASHPRPAVGEPRVIPDRSPLGIIVSLLALSGAVLAMRSPATRQLPLLVMAYSAPYVLLMPWFYRYRLPIEPVLLVLAAHAGLLAARSLNRMLWQVLIGKQS